MNQNKHDNDLLIFFSVMAIIAAATLVVAFGAIAATFNPAVLQSNLTQTACNLAWVQAQGMFWK